MLSFCVISLLMMASHASPLPGSNLPDANELAEVARKLVHTVDWVSVATISTQRAIRTYPFNHIQSMADGPLTNGTGVPYFYLTVLDPTSLDLRKDDRSTIMATEAQTDVCKDNDHDPQSPKCARVMLSGRIHKVPKGSEEHAFAKDALLSRHPPMAGWPENHGWYVAKLDIESIMLLSGNGGPRKIAVEDYFEVKLP